MHILESSLLTSGYATNIGRKAPVGKVKESSLAALSAMVLYDLNKDLPRWPLSYAELYLDDALGARQWVDSIDARSFCSNIVQSLVQTQQCTELGK